MRRRQYTEEFKREAVAMVEAGQGVEAVARSLGLPPGSLWNWVAKATGPTPAGSTGAGTGEAAPVDPAAYAALQRRVAELERENEFLGKASAYFAGKAQRKP